MSLSSQVLAAINFSDATAIVTAAGLALIGLAFLGFVLRKANESASGRIGSDDDDEKDD